MAEQPPHRAPPQYGPDGRWWWDGQRWIPVPQPTPSALPPSPVEQPSRMAGPAAVVEARRAPIQLGGIADRRFERRFVAVRRAVRYLLLANVLGWVLVFTFNTYGRLARASGTRSSMGSATACRSLLRSRW